MQEGQWTGHVDKMSNTGWANITSEWTPREGKRVRGRPKGRWRENIEEVGSSQWMRVAQIEVHGVSCGGHLPAVA